MSIDTSTIEDPTQEIADEAIHVYESSLKQSATQSTLVRMAERVLFRRHGFTYVDDETHPPIEKLNSEFLARRVFETISEAVVVTKEDRDTVPLTRYKLAGAVLDQFPTPEQDEWEHLDAMERAGWEQAEKTIWKAIQIKPNDRMQRWAREHLPDGTQVVRTKDTVFVTAEPKYLTTGLVLPLRDKFEKDAAAMGEMIGLYSKYTPALRPRAYGQLNQATKNAADKARAAFAINAPDEPDSSDEE